MNNDINTKQYWEQRFINNWGKVGRKQTHEYANANVKMMNLNIEFNGSILDFGCATGDSIPIYKKHFPNAKLYGVDIAKQAISVAIKNWGDIAEFYSLDYQNLPDKYNTIIASHVMEHLNEDKKIVIELLNKCNILYIFVPYKEKPLYKEHVNYYDENYYNNFEILDRKIFSVKFKQFISVKEKIKRLISLNFKFYFNFEKDIIMFKIKGNH